MRRWWVEGAAPPMAVVRHKRAERWAEGLFRRQLGGESAAQSLPFTVVRVRIKTGHGKSDTARKSGDTDRSARAGSTGQQRRLPGEASDGRPSGPLHRCAGLRRIVRCCTGTGACHGGAAQQRQFGGNGTRGEAHGALWERRPDRTRRTRQRSDATKGGARSRITRQ